MIHSAVSTGGTLQANGGITISRVATSPTYLSVGTSWAGTEDTAFYGTRTSLVPRVAKSFSTNFTMGAQANGDWSNLSIAMKYQRPSTSPTKMRAVLTWQEGTTYKRAYTSAATLSGNVWTGPTTARFQNGDALPASMAGLQCLLEVYFFGTSTTPNAIYVDEVKILCNSLAAGWTISPSSIIDWPVNKAYSLQPSVVNYAGTVAWTKTGTLPTGLSQNASTGEISGTPTAIGSSSFSITASGAGLNQSQSYTLNIVAAPTALPAGRDLAKWTFDSDASATILDVPSVIDASVAEVSWGYDGASGLTNGLSAGGSGASSSTPVNAAKGGAMRSFANWASSSSYASTRNSLLHFNTGSSARFAVYPTANTSSVPTTSQTNKGEKNAVQVRLKLDANASGDLSAFYFDGLRWTKDVMTSSGVNGPRWVQLHAYWMDNNGAVQSWDSDVKDVTSIYYPEYRGANQFGRYWFDLDANAATGLNARVKTTTAQYKERTVFFDLYFWHDTGADLTGINGSNPPSILLDEMGVVGSMSTSACPSLLSTYNVITSNSLQTSTAIEGRAVVNAIAGTNAFTAGRAVGGTGARANLLVQGNVAAGGDITMQSGSLYIPATSQLNGRNVVYKGGGSTLTGPTFDFTSLFGAMSSESFNYRALTTNSTVSIPTSPGTATLVVNATLSSSDVAVFSVAGNSLFNNSNVQQIDLNLNGAQPAWIVVNVTGSAVGYGNSGTMIGNLVSSTWRSRLLWNFPQATTILINKTFYGAIMAPNATLTSTSVIEGSVAVKDLVAGGEVHLPLFQGGACPPVFSIGNLVWNDINNNGIKDAGEAGLAGVVVQLFSPGTDNAIGGTGTAADTQVGSNILTDTNGAYLFTGLAEGKYFVKVIPPAAYPYTGGTPVTLDNQTDNDNNGAQPGGAGTALYSPVIDVAVGAEPINDADLDPSTDTTVDFGLYTGMTLGNLVWNDANGNGVFDNGEGGIDNVLVELWSPGADGVIGGLGANADIKVGSTTTAGGGLYSFSNLMAGQYFVKVPTPPLPRVSLVVDSADNGQDGDNNGAQPGGVGTSAYSPIITLIPATEPGSSGSTNVDNTIDFGFVGNAGSPFVCDNRFYMIQSVETFTGSGVFDTTLYYVGTGPTLVPLFIFNGKRLNGLASYAGFLYCVDQQGNHLYRINSLGVLVDMGAVPGLPSPGSTGQWSGGTALANGRLILNQVVYSTTSNATYLYTVDLASASLVTSGVQCVNALNSSPITANFGDIALDPLTGNVYGYATNDPLQQGLWKMDVTTGRCTQLSVGSVATYGSLAIDANGIAYGYGSPVNNTAVQNTLYMFNRTNGVLNGTQTAIGTGPAVSGTDGAACSGSPVTMKMGNLVWYDANNNGIKDASESGISGVTVQLFMGGQTHASATPVAITTTDANGGYLFSNLSPGQYFVYLPAPPAAYPSTGSLPVALDNDVDNDNNGIQAAKGQPVYSPLIALSPGTEPTNDGDSDSNTNLSVDFGLTVSMSIGNLVWADANNNGLKESSELGIGGATVQLFSPGVDNALGTADDIQVGSNVTTGVTGAYNFSGLAPGKYYVKVTPPAAYPLTSGTPVTIDDSVDNNNDGTQPGGAGTPLYSQIITLVPGSESITDGDTDANTNLTVDFGLFTGFTVGNLVWYDANNNGIRDSGETGIGGLTVELLNGSGASFVPAITTSTNSSGAYGFTVYMPGSYKIKVTPNATYPRASTTVGLDNGTDNNNDGNQSVGAGTASISFAFTLTAGGEPGTAGTTATENTIDFGFTTCPTITITPTTLTSGTVGTGYNQSLLASGGTSPYTWALVSGTLPTGLALSSGGVLSGTPANNTTQIFTVQAMDSKLCPGTLSYTMTPFWPSDYGDDSRLANASSFVSTSIRMGALVDSEAAPVTNAAATGDDITGSDDEDGVTMPNHLNQGAAATILVKVTNTSGAPAYLSGWIDFNNNGSLNESNEQVASNLIIPTGTVNSTQTIGVVVPVGAATATVTARFRLTSTSSPGPTGASGVGEVEDHTVIIYPSCGFSNTLWLSTSSGAGGRLETYNITTGAKAIVGFTSDSTNHTLFDLAWSPGGKLYGIEVASGKTSVFLISSTTGALTKLGSVNGVFNGMVFDGDGTPYVSSSSDGGIYTFSISGLSAGSTSPVALLFDAPATAPNGQNLASGGDLAFVGADLYYAAVGGSKFYLYKVPAGSSTMQVVGEMVNTSGSSIPNIYGLIGDGYGSIYAQGDSNLYKLNRTNAVASSLSSGISGNSIYGGAMQFEACQVNEDHGDYSLFGDASSTAYVSLRMGALVDGEYTQSNATATADDNTGVDDDDGVTVPGTLTPGQTSSLVVNVTNTNGLTAYLNAWIDFDGDGDLADSGEQIATNQIVANGTSGSNVTLNFTTPITAKAGTVGVRVRLTSTISPGATGSSGFGEVEDYVTTVATVNMSIGNMVWNDANNNGIKDSSETGIGGVTVQLFNVGADNTVNTADDTQVGSNVVTGVTGAYIFANIPPGKYYVKVTPPTSYPLTSGTPATTDNNVDHNNDGAQPGGAGTPLYSPMITLSPGAESVTDGDTDANTNLTVDFGLFTGFVVGNLVWYDANNNGVKDATEAGISGLAVELLNSSGLSFSPAITTTTNTSGAYGFSVYQPGTYRIKATPNSIYPRASTSAGTDNGTDNNNDGTQLGGAGSASMSFAFTLAAAGEPGAAGTGNAENTIDFGFTTCPTIAVTPATLPAGTIGSAYSQSLAASGGASPYSWGLSSGSLPSGLSISSGGVLSGTPLATGTFSFGLAATDAALCGGTQVCTLTVACPTLAFSPASLPSATAGASYSTSITASGGAAPYAYSLQSGTLPAGLNLSNTGVLSGTPTSNAGQTFTVKVVDNNGCVGVQTYTMSPGCPAVTISPVSVSSATIGSAYSQQMTANGGSGPYTWSVSSGSLPGGLTLSATGLLSGTPTSSAVQTFTLLAADANACTGAATYTVSPACQTITVTTNTLPATVVGSPYNQTLSASNGMGGYTWTVYSGSLPAGLTLSSGGVLSGTPTSNASATFTVRATDVNGCKGNMTYTVLSSCPSVTVTPATLSGAVVGSVYSAVLSAGGGVAPYTWTVASGTLPAGLTLASGGALRGTPTSTTSQTFTVKAADVNGCFGTKIYTLAPVCPTVAVSPASIPNGTLGAAYSQALVATGGSGSYTWTVFSGTLPSGLILSSGGVLSGTPTNVTSQTFAVQAADANGCKGTASYTMAPVCPLITVAPSALPGATVGNAYSQTLSGNNGTAPYAWSVLTGTLPEGLSLSTAGVLSGTPTSTVSQTFTLQAADANGCKGTASYTLDPACGTISLTPATLPGAVAGSSYNHTLGISGSNGAVAWTVISGTLPSGLVLSSSGLISGIPVSTVAQTFTVKATDANGCSGTISYTLAPTCPTLVISPSTLANAVVGGAYTQAFSSDGVGTLSWAISSGTLPAGLALNSATGVISGTAPAVTSTTSITMKVTDGLGCTGTKSFTLSVTGLSIGNLVWNDANGNGIYDLTEAGVAGATVQLFTLEADSTAYTQDDVQVGTTQTTLANGSYRFDNLSPGNYWVKVAPPTSLPLATANIVLADNGIDNDNNGAQPGGSGTALRSPVIALAAGTEPTSEDADANTDLTVDFGLFQGLSVGNLVWNDLNRNGMRDDGEPGITGVLVQMFSAGADGKAGGADDALLLTSTTDSNGAYLFSGLLPGKYYLRLPTPPAAAPLASPVASLADNGVDNDSNGIQTGGGPIYSPVITLATLTEPGSSGGTNLDLTVDFGLIGSPLGAFTTVANDDAVHVYHPDSGAFCSVFKRPFGNNASQGNGDSGDVPWGIELGPDGNWYVSHLGAGNIRRITAAGVDQGVVLSNLPGIQQLSKFVFGPDGNFYVLDPLGSRVVRYAGPLSTSLAPGVPLDGAPHAFIAKSARDIAFGPDANVYLLVKNGSAYQVERYNAGTGAYMNTILTASQVGGMVNGGDSTPVISGIEIRDATLYGVTSGEGEVFKVSLIDPATPGTPQLVADLDNAGIGSVDTEDLKFNPANGLLYVCGYRWVKTVQDGFFLSSALIKVDPGAAANAAPSFCELVMPTPPGPANETFPGVRDVAFGPNNIAVAAICSLGSQVWNDLNFDGQYQTGEPGIPNVKIELWYDANNDLSDGTEQLVGWTYSDAYGHYLFDGLVPGRYQAVISTSNFAAGGPLATFKISASIGTTAVDNQVDGDNNGYTPGDHGGAVCSPLITLAVGTEPVGNAQTGLESIAGGDLDDLLGDANGDMTVDFAFYVPGTMGIGNLVFNDINGNSHYNDGEGIDGVQVELYANGQTPGVSLPIASQTTANGGRYLFTNLVPGSYVVFIPSSQFGSSGILRGMFSVPGHRELADDDRGEKGLDTSSPEVTGVRCDPVVLAHGQAPTGTSVETGFDSGSDDEHDSDNDLTIDFGFYTRVGLGNLVFFDANGDGVASGGEGVANVTVQLYHDGQTPEQDPPISTSVTNGTGQYQFLDLQPGYYVVHIPSTMFQAGKPLAGYMSIAEGRVGDDDVGEDGLNDTTPSQQGVSSAPVLLMAGTAPTFLNGETGFDSAADDTIDAAIDFTVDFGFQRPVSIGNMVFFDANNNGHYDGGEGVGNVQVQLYLTGSTPGFSVPIRSITTDASGHYRFSGLSGGYYFVYIPATQFGAGQPLFNIMSIPGVALAGSDDNAGEDGQDSGSPAITGIRSSDVLLQAGSCPTGETGYLSNGDSSNDIDSDMTIDLGFTRPVLAKVGVGNAVFTDLNGNGHYDEGEGVSGVTLRLYPSTIVAPTTQNAVATTTTDSGGGYYFGNLNPGRYYIVVPESNFTGTGKLVGQFSLPGQGGDNDLDDDADENGDDPADPAANGVRSTVFDLAVGLMPNDFDTETGKDTYSDDVIDENSNLTIDFGFYTPVGVGNLVFVDANGNGHADAGEGIGGVTVKLYKIGDDPVTMSPRATRVSSSDAATKGSFMFTGLQPGSYFLHIPSTMFASGAPLAGKVSMTGAQSSGGDDFTGEDGIDPVDIISQGISTAVFTLRPGAMPSGTAENGLYGSADNATQFGDKNYDLTWDFGFVSNVKVGNLVFRDVNSDGKYTDGVDAGVSGVTVQIYRQDTVTSAPVLVGTTTTDSLGRYLFSVPPASYFVKIPATMFQSGAPLVHTQATALRAAGDDDVGQDATSGDSPLADGAKTSVFQLAGGMMPTTASGETGYDSASDNVADAESNLTIDLGFKPLPLSVGNLVFRDSNANSLYDAGDFGVGGVMARLFAEGSNPQTATPLAETVTKSDGSYLLSAYAAGSYFVHIAKANFATGAPLLGLVSSSGFGNDNRDDNVNENGIDAATPSATGINSAPFSLAYDSAPTDANTETGFGAASDNAADSDTNLTIDFGFRVPAVGAPLAGKVRRDLTATGVGADTSPALSGVEITLYTDPEGSGSTDTASLTAVRTTTTAEDGSYHFDGLSQGTYVVVQTALPGGVPTAAIDSTEPDRTAVAIENSAGVRGIDFLQSLSPDTFSQWQTQHSQNGSTGANDNPDGDLYDNLFAYAFSLDGTGVRTVAPFKLEVNSQTGDIDAVLARRSGGHSDVTYMLEGSISGQPSSTWTRHTIAPAVEANSNGFESVRYPSINTQAIFKGATLGYVRLKVLLDADHNGVTESSSVSPVFAFNGLSLPAAQTTLSMPLLKNEVFSGVILSVADGSLSVASSGIKEALEAGRAYYAEVMDGPHEGERYDLNESATTGSLIVLETPPQIPVNLAGARVTVRPHWTLDEVLPANRFHADHSASAADRVMFFENGAYKIHWVLATANGPRWVMDGDATLKNTGSTRLIGPATGLLIHARAQAVILPLIGQVRANAFAMTLTAGPQLVGSGWPVSQTPAGRGMTAINGFATGDYIRLWAGDWSPGAVGYLGNVMVSVSMWTREDDMNRASVSDTPLFGAFRAAFVSPGRSIAWWKQPVPTF